MPVFAIFKSCVFDVPDSSSPKSSEEETVATTGSIQVNSTPAEAQVFLDGSDSGQVTNTTLTGVSAGSHEIKVTKEGYVDYEESVHVSGGETATLNANLSKHTINVTSPAAGAVLIKGKKVQIKWSTGGGNSSRGNSYFTFDCCGQSGGGEKFRDVDNVCIAGLHDVFQHGSGMKFAFSEPDPEFPDQFVQGHGQGINHAMEGCVYILGCGLHSCLLPCPSGASTLLMMYVT